MGFFCPSTLKSNFRYCEKAIGVLFAGMVLSWFFRDPKIFPGWGELFPSGFVPLLYTLLIIVFCSFVSDSTVSLFFSLLLFVVPAENPFKDDFTENGKATKLKPILTWKLVHHRLSWGTILLLGGGYAMAKGVETSGLSLAISDKLSALSNFPNWVFVIFTCVMVTSLTEFSSNIATASIFIPLVASIVIFS